MKTIKEIENAIEGLSAAEVVELAAWIERLQARGTVLPAAQAWLEHARGTAAPGVTTEGVMALTRGDR
jgi:hypothetical protein